jgi:hypothetical protein
MGNYLGWGDSTATVAGRQLQLGFVQGILWFVQIWAICDLDQKSSHSIVKEESAFTRDVRWMGAE